MTQEDRRSPRCPLIASVELIDVQTNARFKTRTSDVSVVGCYLDTMSPLPVGTEVRLKISHCDLMITVLGVITQNQPNMGMGIRFIDISLDDHEILEAWLAVLTRG
ncbi:MAG TPA: PilZ domain-containing protein [Candidatus Acidoferrales bacterium]|nr:PilZ domain-containing protein [Candidatus Acidoferrales bacterium]